MELATQIRHTGVTDVSKLVPILALLESRVRKTRVTGVSKLVPGLPVFCVPRFIPFHEPAGVSKWKRATVCGRRAEKREGVLSGDGKLGDARVRESHLARSDLADHPMTLSRKT
jgi:hypothetical protein